MRDNWEYPPEVWAIPERVARRLARRYPGVDWEDIRQDGALWLLERPQMVAEYLAKGDVAIGYLERNMRHFLVERLNSDARKPHLVDIQEQIDMGRL